MNTIHTTATLGTDGILHVPIPGAKPGVTYEVAASPVEKVDEVKEVDEFGWPIGFHDRMYGCITDEKFVAPHRGMPREVPSLDGE